MRPETAAVRGGLQRTGWDESTPPIALTSGFVYGSAAEAEAAFKGEHERYIYSRYGNPTIGALEERLAIMEGSEVAQTTASGMAAVFLSLVALVQAGDRIVASRALFGSCTVILDELLPRLGVHTDFVDGTNLDEWEAALSKPAKAVFFETVSNPMLELIDVAAVSELAHQAGAVVVADNVFATQAFQRPLGQGADLVVYSTTKHFDGGGRTLGGVVCCDWLTKVEALQPFVRHTGPAMSPFTAWVLSNALETYGLRVNQMADNAAELARRLADHSSIQRLWYPTEPSHPQYELAAKQMTKGGTIVTVDVGSKERAFELLDRTELIDISNNLGDAKSLLTHPASTTHRRLGPQGRAAVGIGDGVVRLSVGLESVEDLWDDIERALSR